MKFVISASSHKIVQGMGMQQHSKPSHSMHLVRPGTIPPGLMRGVEGPGSTWLTRAVRDEEAIASDRCVFLLDLKVPTDGMRLKGVGVD
jgi:hypothetical protein